MRPNTLRSALPAIIALPATSLLGCSSGQILNTVSNPTVTQTEVPTRTGIPYYLPEAAIPVTISFSPRVAGQTKGTEASKAAGPSSSSTSSPTITINLSPQAKSTKEGTSPTGDETATMKGKPNDTVSATGESQKGLVVTVGSPQFRADPRLHAFLEYTRDPAADDTFGLHVDSATGLLTTSKGETVDQSGQVAAAIVQTVETVAKDVLAPGGGLLNLAQPRTELGVNAAPNASTCLANWKSWTNLPQNLLSSTKPLSDYKAQCPKFANTHDERKNACYLAWEHADLANPGASKYPQAFCPSLDIPSVAEKPKAAQAVDNQRCEIGSYKLSGTLVPDSGEYDNKATEQSIGDYKFNPLTVKGLGKALNATLVDQTEKGHARQEIDLNVSAELESTAQLNADQLPADTKEPGILFRDWIPWIITTTVSPNLAARQACSVVAQIEKVRVLIPNGGPFFYEDMSREPLIDKKFGFTVSNGMLTGVDVTRPSFAKAVASLPLTLVKPILSAPFQAVTSGSSGSSTSQSASTGGGTASAGSP